ncbi:MAG TPA: hypothetical protein VIE36_03130 [Methylomirabilota bacterium]|jgi:hypothetical protein
MGSGAGGYVGVRLQTLLSEYDLKTRRLHRVSQLSFSAAPIPSFAPPKGIAEADAGPPPGTPLAGKLGLGGVRPGEVEHFRLFAPLPDGGLFGMGATGDKGITDELVDAFGGRWAGFAVSVAPKGSKFNLIADIKLKPRWKGRASRPFQVIPVVMAFGSDRFVDHYLLALIAAQKTREQVETSVVQPYYEDAQRPTKE